MRIISGKFKGTVLTLPKKCDFMPTKSVTRAAIFNKICACVLDNYIEDSNFLDVFSGSGIMSFEALSHGAKHVGLIDKNLDSFRSINNFATKIGVEDKMNCFCHNIEHLPIAKMQYNIIFIDPPYKENLLAVTLENLEKKLWIADNANLIIEKHKRDNFKPPAKYEAICEHLYGNTSILFLLYKK